jgi:hypothetical protein
MPGGLLRWAEAIVTGDDGSEEGWDGEIGRSVDDAERRL